MNRSGLRVVRRKEENEFRFGNAGTLISTEIAQIPLWLGRKRVVMHAAILPGTGSHTPFLFSEELLRQLVCVLDMQSDVCYFYRLSETQIKLSTWSLRHSSARGQAIGV